MTKMKIPARETFVSLCEADTKLARFRNDLAARRQRAEELAGELASVQEADAPAKLAERLRSGENVPLTAQTVDRSAMERELADCRHAAAVIGLALEQEEAALVIKEEEANRQVEQKLAGVLKDLDERRASAFCNFALAGQERIGLGEALKAAGWHAAGESIAAGGVLKEFGVLEERNSPLTLILLWLLDKGFLRERLKELPEHMQTDRQRLFVQMKTGLAGQHANGAIYSVEPNPWQFQQWHCETELRHHTDAGQGYKWSRLTAALKLLGGYQCVQHPLLLEKARVERIERHRAEKAAA